MVAPTWCYGPNWGNFFLRWMPTDRPTHFNLVIRVGKVEQSAILLSVVSHFVPPIPPSFCPSVVSILRTWSRSELPQASFFAHVQAFDGMTHNTVQAGTRFPGVVISSFWWLSGEVEHFVHQVHHLNLNSCSMPTCGLTDYRPFEGITCDFLGRNWIPCHSVALIF